MKDDIRRPLGCHLAMSVLQSDMYHKLGEPSRADCDELVAMNIDWLKGVNRKPVAGKQETEAAISAALWERQLELHPTSVRLTPQTVIKWAQAPLEGFVESVDTQDALTRYKAIAVALQYGMVVWYRIPGVSGVNIVTGCRYGLDRPDYLSGFSHL